MATTHDDRFIVSASHDHTLRVWDAASGQPTHIVLNLLGWGRAPGQPAAA